MSREVSLDACSRRIGSVSYLTNYPRNSTGDRRRLRGGFNDDTIKKHIPCPTDIVFTNVTAERSISDMG